MTLQNSPMEDRRTALAIFLCIIVVMMYSELFVTPSIRQPLPKAATSSSSVPAPAAPGTVAPAAPIAGAAGSPAAPLPVPGRSAATVSELASHPTIRIESADITAEITQLGVRLSHFRLKNYRRTVESTEPLDMVVAADDGLLPLGIYSGDFSDALVPYTLQSASLPATDGVYSISGERELKLVFQGTFPGGAPITKTITFAPKTHLFTVEARLASAVPTGAPLALEWVHFTPGADALQQVDQPSFVMLDSANKIQTVYLADLEPLENPATVVLKPAGRGSWLAFADRYFLSALIAPEGDAPLQYGRQGDQFITRVRGGELSTAVTLFVGPKSYEDLKDVGFQLHRSIDLGWFSFLAHPLLAALRFFYGLLGNWGLAIILLTLVIKAAFLPLTKASFNSMQAMQELQPEIKALRDRITDPTQLNREMMELYKRKGVNPMGGCLPVLVQIPVFLGLYNALLNSIELRHAPFALWINDLSSPEHLDVFGIGVPVMVLIMGASMFIQQWTTPTTMDPAQKKIFMLMPVIFTVSFIIFPFPAGLVLYWLVNNLISIIQQVYLRSEIKASPLKATALASLGIFAFGFVLTLI